jgi:uncharacterized damage-inducible protein DinB
MRLKVAALLLISVPLFAQENPYTAHSRFTLSAISKILLSAAEKMPEEHFTFRPVETVRTFGQIVGHVADSQYLFCSIASGAKNPAPKIEQTKTSKADLVAALKEAFTYCESSYAAMNDVAGAEKTKFGGREMPKLGIFSINQAHTMEHYGNMVTYMRMKGVVPPTSDPEFAKSMRN